MQGWIFHHNSHPKLAEFGDFTWLNDPSDSSRNIFEKRKLEKKKSKNIDNKTKIVKKTTTLHF